MHNDLGSDFVFYDRFVKLCDAKNVSPSRAAVEAGISKSLVTKWKQDATKEPSADVVRKLAQYFGISRFEVLEDRPANYSDPELQDYLEELKTRPELRMLFKLSKNATKQEVEQAVRVIEALRRKE